MSKLLRSQNISYDVVLKDHDSTGKSNPIFVDQYEATSALEEVDIYTIDELGYGPLDGDGYFDDEFDITFYANFPGGFVSKNVTSVEVYEETSPSYNTYFGTWEPNEKFSGKYEAEWGKIKTTLSTSPIREVDEISDEDLQAASDFFDGLLNKE